jgi:uncharacterized membrane protein
MTGVFAFHSFLSHFPPALFLAGLILLFLARKRDNPVLGAAASLDFSIGFLMSVMAVFSGLLAEDMGSKTAVLVESHQVYSFLCVVFYGFCMGFSYTKANSGTAIFFYLLTFLVLGASVWSGYLLVFFSPA